MNDVQRNSGRRWTPGRIALWSGFLVTGVATVLPGPLIPELRPTWGVDQVASALLFPALFIATSVGSVLSSFRLRWSLLVGYLAMGVGFAALAFVPWPYPIAALVAVGFGVGLVNPATNLLVAHETRDDHETARGATLARLNLVWGVGAVSCPLLFALVRESLRVELALSALALVAFGVYAALQLDATVGRTAIGPTSDRPYPPADEPAPPPRSGRLAGIVSLLPIAAILFLYVGTEAAVGGWLVELADEIGGIGVASMLVGSGYWAALLVGRALVPWALGRLSQPAVFVAGLSIALAGVTVLWTADSRTAAALGGALAGFGLSPIFPLTVSFLAEQTAATGSRGTGWVFAFMGLGGAAMPWVMVRLPGVDVDLTKGFVIPWLAIVAMIGVLAVQRRFASSTHRR